MTVCFLVADINLCGGGERVALNLAHALNSKFGMRTKVVSIQAIRYPLPLDIPRGVDLESLGVKLHCPRVLRKVVARFQAIHAARSWIQANSGQVILGIGTLSSVVLSFVQKSQICRIGCEHIWLQAPPWFWRVVRKFRYPHLDAVVTLTAQDQKRACRLNSVVKCIPNGRTFDDGRTADPHRKRILSMGRLDHQKGFDRLLASYACIKDRFPDWELVIIGEGPLRNALRDRIDQLGLRDQVSLKNNTRDVISEYLASSIFALASRYEGLPMVLIEAQSLGLPAVSMDCPTGPRDIIVDSETGFLIPQGNLKLFSERLARLMEDVELRRLMGQRAKSMSERFDQERICRQWIECFDELACLKDPASTHG